jgi:hypothetical protein
MLTASPQIGKRWIRTAVSCSQFDLCVGRQEIVVFLRLAQDLHSLRLAAAGLG